MAAITIDLPEENSHEGVTKEFLEVAAAERGCSPGRLVSIALANLLGFERPDDPADLALRAALEANGIPQDPPTDEAREQMREIFR